MLIKTCITLEKKQKLNWVFLLSPKKLNFRSYGVFPFDPSPRSSSTFNSSLSKRKCSQHLGPSSIQFDCNPLLSSLHLLIIYPPFSRFLHCPYRTVPLSFFCPLKAAFVHFDYSSQARTVDQPSGVFYLLIISGIP